MNSIDLAILGIMTLSCLMGIIRGVTKEVLSLFTWAGSALAAYTLYSSASGIAREHIANPMIADGITGTILFIVFLIIFGIITVAISNAVKDSMMGGLDRSLGLAFGIVRGVFAICIVEIIFSLFIHRDKQSETIQHARFITMVRHGSDEIVSLLPLNTQNMILSQTQKLQGMAPMVGSVNDLVILPVPVQPSALKNNPQDLLKGMAPQRTQKQTVLRPEQPDSEKTMEGLSLLKPQATKLKSEGVYDNRQQRELDRLIETSE
ncbi:MAG: CvpA family protein [Candidatus Paracaedibacteraceae bacterium]|nr:CvpA family protein [Candidatus Paracaedibacteraceae bacterium]